MQKKNRRGTQVGSSSPKNRRGTQVGGTDTGGGAVGKGKNFAAAPLWDSDVDPQWNGYDSGKYEPRECGNPIVVKFSAFTKQGFSPYSKKPNQDSLVLYEDPATGSLMFGTLDGHGKDGHKISRYFVKRLPAAIFQHPLYPKDLSKPKAERLENMKKAVAESIAKIETALLKDQCTCTGQCVAKGDKCTKSKNAGNSQCCCKRIHCELSGTTFVMGIVMDGHVLLANIGDSRCIAGVKEGNKVVAKEYTKDHKPESPGEKERILAAGGRVFAITYDDGVEGPQRVWLGDMDLPGIAMARSLGDCVAHTAGVISEPEFTDYALDGSVSCLVMATDGLWEFLSNEAVIKMWSDKNGDVEAAMKVMVEKSTQLWMKEEGVVDDTTIIIANIDASKMPVAAAGDEAKAE